VQALLLHAFLIYDPNLYDLQQLCLIMCELVFNEFVRLCTSVLSAFITWTFYTVKFESVFSLCAVLSFCPAWRDG